MTTATAPLVVPLNPAGVLHPDVWSDLPGAAWDCFDLVREVYRRLGVALGGPLIDSGDGWTESASDLAPGDVALACAEGVTHVGVLLGGDLLLHAAGRHRVVAVGSLAAWRRAGILRGVYRYAGPLAADPIPPAAPSTVRVVHAPDLIRRPAVRVTTFVPDGILLRAAAPPGANVVVTAKGPRRLEEVEDRVLGPGETVLFCTLPRFQFLLPLLIGLALSALSLLLAPALPKPRDEDEESSPSFDFGGIRNTAQVGIAQPVLYGERKVGGNFISAFQRIGDDGRAELYVLLFISIGPIDSDAGISTDVDELTGAAIPDGIEIDGNAASNYDCAVSIRLGSSDQLPIPGFYETAVAYPQTPTLDDAVPFHYETVAAVEGFDLNLSFPLGLHDFDTGSGATLPRTAVFAIRWRQLGAATWLTDTWTLTRARRTAFPAQYRKRGLARDRYEIEIERVSPAWPDPLTNAQSQSVLTAVQEVTGGARTHPGKALVALRVRATEQLSGSIPNFTVVARGRKVWIWDGVSTTAPAFGSSEVYTASPAWCVLDMLLNPRYGGGRGNRVSVDNVSLEELLSWAEASAHLVSDGRGGTAPRAECHLLLDTTTSLWETVRAVAGAAWARLYLAGNSVRVILDAFGAGGPPTVPEFVFGMGNSRNARFSYAGRSRRPNVVEVQYANAETEWESDVVTRADADAASGAANVLKETLQVPGCTRPYQAARMAQFRENFHRLIVGRASWESGPEAIHLLPGAVVALHGQGVWDGFSGRILVPATGSSKFDRDITVTVRARLYLKKADDVIATNAYVAPGTYARGSAVAFVDAAGAPTTVAGLAAGDNWILPDPTGAGRTRLYRITKIETDEDLTRRFEAHAYDPAVFDDDPGDVETFTDALPNRRAVPAAATVAARHLEDVSCEGVVVDGILVEFATPERWQYGEIWYRDRGAAGFEEGGWVFAGWGRDRYVVAPLAGCRAYEVAVIGVGPAGSRQRIEDAAKTTVFLRGRRAAPLVPTGLVVAVVAGVLRVSVTPPADPTVAGYEIRYGTTFAGSVRLARCAAAEWSAPCPFVGTETIRVKAVSRAGVHSLAEVTASATHVAAESVYTVDVNANDHAGFAGTKTDATVTGSELQISGSNLSGTYQTPDRTTVVTKEVQEIRIRCRARIADVAATWDECTHTWDEATWTWDTCFLRGDEIEAARRLPSWDSWGFAWDSMPAALLTWSGGTDVLEALTPLVEYDVNTGSGFLGAWTEYRGPVSVANLTGVRARVTLRRPHTRFDPRLVELNVQTLMIGASEPVVYSGQFYATSATAVNTSVRGFSNSTNVNQTIRVPTGKKLVMLGVQGHAETGATAGTYRLDFGFYNVTDTTFVSCAAVSGGANTDLFAAAEGTRAAPLATLSAGKEFLLSFQNAGSSPGALANTVHRLTASWIFEDV